jgi:hypothetical protein
MAEAAAKPATRTARPEAEPQVPVLDFRKYVEYRLSTLTTPIHGGRLGGAEGVRTQSIRTILNELLELADWLEKGSPTPLQSLNETDKQFYRDAVARGLTVPDEIKAQL